MKSVIRVSVVAAIFGMSFGMASDADARCCFLKKLFNRGCCQPSCCEPACGCESDCGCGAPADCGCGGEVVVEEGVIIEEGSEPTEASPSDLQEVPDPPATETPATENPQGDVKPGDIPADDRA
ncbi:hypothetical protein [Aeoliella sp.]|uniref:hypothetical protein n=1 Tax=Aeoliella sp. TaxID=2795800 RepID=UPI003CCC2013